MSRSYVGTATSPGIAATPRWPFVGVVEAERRLISALRTMRHRTKGAQSKAIEALARDFLGRPANYKGILHLIRLARDAYDRGAPIEDLKAFSREYDALIDSWEEERSGRVPLCRHRIHSREERAEAVKELAETDFSYDASPANAERLLSAIDAHNAANRDMAKLARSVLNGSVA